LTLALDVLQDTFSLGCLIRLNVCLTGKVSSTRQWSRAPSFCGRCSDGASGHFWRLELDWWNSRAHKWTRAHSCLTLGFLLFPDGFFSLGHQEVKVIHVSSFSRAFSQRQQFIRLHYLTPYC